MQPNISMRVTHLSGLPLFLALFAAGMVSHMIAQNNSDWVLRYEAPGKYDHPTDIAFLDDDHAIVTINHGVLVTSDGGTTWRRELMTEDTVLFSIPMTSVAVQNSSTAWVCGWFGALYRTMDNGATFEDRSLNRMFHSERVYFLDENIGWIAGDSVERGSGKGLLHKTTDGGENWSIQARFPFDPASAMYWITWTDIDFADQLHGWMVGQKGGMARTIDGGDTWLEFDEMADAEMFCVSALSADHVLMGGERQIFLESQNAGSSWTRRGVPPGIGIFHDIDMYDAFDGYVAGKGLTTCMARTTDGGVTWNPDTLVSGEWRRVNAVTRAPDGTFWAVTYEGEIFERTGHTTAVVDDAAGPRTTSCTAFPSPLWTGRTLTLEISLPIAGAVRADLYDITGRHVRVLCDGFQQAGSHTLNTPRIDLSPGMYVIRFRTNDGVQIVKLPVMP